jgi:radical SAM domain protein
LQPCDVGDETANRRIMAYTVEFCKAHPEWRLSLQTHKIAGIR